MLTRAQSGAGAIPKRAVDTSECEIGRLLLATDDAIVPVSLAVPRKVRVCVRVWTRRSAVGGCMWNPHAHRTLFRRIHS